MPPTHATFATATAAFPDESLIGLLTRAFARSAIRNTAQALGLAGVIVPKSAHVGRVIKDHGAVEAIAALIGVDATVVAARLLPSSEDRKSVLFATSPIREWHLESRVKRVAPRALIVANYHRANWLLRPLAFDPCTLELLLDRCPVCGELLGWSRSYGVSKCDRCVDHRGLPSVDLRDFPQPLVDDLDADALRFVADLLHPGEDRQVTARRHLVGPLSGLTSPQVFEVVVRLAAGLGAPPSVEMGRPAAGRFVNPRSLATAARAVLSGPGSFQRLLERICAGEDAKSNRRSDHHPLRNLWGFVDASWSVGMTAYLKHALRSVTRPRRLGGPTVTKAANDNQRTDRSAKQCAAIFGYSTRELLLLSTLGHIKQIGEGSGLPEMSPRIHVGSVVELQRKLHVISQSPAYDHVDLSTALRALKPSARHWVSAVDLILRGELQAHLEGPLGKDWRRQLRVASPIEARVMVEHRAAELEATFDQAGGSRAMTIAEAAEYLRTRPTVVGRLLNADILKGNRTAPETLLRAEVETFRREYALGHELVVGLGLSNGKQLRPFLAQRGVHPRLRGSRRGDLVYDRNEVKHLLAAKTPTWRSRRSAA